MKVSYPTVVVFTFFCLCSGEASTARDNATSKKCPLLLRPLCAIAGILRRIVPLRWRKGNLRESITPSAPSLPRVSADIDTKEEGILEEVKLLRNLATVEAVELDSSGGMEGIAPLISRSVLDAKNGVELWTLKEPTTGVNVTICTLGATIVEFWAPDSKGMLDDIVLGFDNDSSSSSSSSSDSNSSGGGGFGGLAAAYMSAENPYFGAVVGRVGGRRLFLGRQWVQNS